ncbi:hypothetical protein [Methylobacterium sp. V23]|uniref:hypothetical protein n=1 Tax=Methylobacterium sp. V23 TaxID=2044878 RepID=UPI0011B07F10|nr:hypothetical protein [Methylobacterium sp. V23]
MHFEYPYFCFPRPDNCNRTPFRVGVDRALALSFPPQIDEDLPDRLADALEALIAALAHPHDAGSRSRPN